MRKGGWGKASYGFSPQIISLFCRRALQKRRVILPILLKRERLRKGGWGKTSTDRIYIQGNRYRHIQMCCFYRSCLTSGMIISYGPQSRLLYIGTLLYTVSDYAFISVLSVHCRMGLQGSVKLHVSFAEYSLLCRTLLQKRPIICGENPYDALSCRSFSAKKPLNIGFFPGK